MRGTKARMLRNLVYGIETHRQRNYFRDNAHGGIIVADKKRRIYKHLKRIYTQIQGLSNRKLESISNELKV